MIFVLLAAAALALLVGFAVGLWGALFSLILIAAVIVGFVVWTTVAGTSGASAEELVTELPDQGPGNPSPRQRRRES